MSGWSHGIAAATTVAAEPTAAITTAKKCGSANLASIRSHIAGGSIQMSKAIIFFIIATPMAIQKIAIPEIIRPWPVVQSSDTYFGEET